MSINFIPLYKDHFPLLLKWLLTSHVRRWWDKDVDWTMERIQKKYILYTEGYKILGEIKKPMHAFIIDYQDTPIGYIQYYNKHDFPPEQGYPVGDLPESLAAIDFYIGETEFLGRGLGAAAVQLFLTQHVFESYNACFVDPDSVNLHAIRSYEKAGFHKIKEIPELVVTWMVYRKSNNI